MGLVFAIYIVLLIVFLAACAMVFRHTIKFGYLSPKFKIIVTVFGVIALIVIIFSFYWAIQLFGAPSYPSYSIPSVGSPSDINF